MKLICNNFIPFHGFIAMNVFGNLFVRNEYAYKFKCKGTGERILNHESIHTELMKDFARFLPSCLLQYIGGIVFYICYLCEWFFRVLFTKDFFSRQAYYHLTFEQEALNNESNLKYLDTRTHFAEWKK